MGGSRGGFAEKFRAMGALAVKIPDEMTSQDAAPLLCAGVTVWSPIHKYVTAGAPLHCQQWRSWACALFSSAQKWHRQLLHLAVGPVIGPESPHCRLHIAACQSNLLSSR